MVKRLALEPFYKHNLINTISEYEYEVEMSTRALSIYLH